MNEQMSLWTQFSQLCIGGGEYYLQIFFISNEVIYLENFMK